MGRPDRSDPWRVAMLHRGLAVALSRRFLGRGLDRADLVQEGMIGLHRAAAGYDPSRGVPFPSYARLHVLRSMYDAVARGGRWAWRRAGDDEDAGEPLAPEPPAALGDDERALVRAAVGRLPDRQRDAIRARYGLDGPPPRCCREIGRDLALSTRTIHYAVAAGLGRLAAILNPGESTR